jgi:hypothetical protein
LEASVLCLSLLGRQRVAVLCNDHSGSGIASFDDQLGLPGMGGLSLVFKHEMRVAVGVLPDFVLDGAADEVSGRNRRRLGVCNRHVQPTDNDQVFRH